LHKVGKQKRKQNVRGVLKKRERGRCKKKREKPETALRHQDRAAIWIPKIPQN